MISSYLYPLSGRKEPKIDIVWMVSTGMYIHLFYEIGSHFLDTFVLGPLLLTWINFNLSMDRTQDSGLKLFIQQQNTWEYTKEMKSYVEQLLHYMVWHRCIKHSSKHSFSLWLIHVRRLPLRLKINRLHGSHHKSKGQGFKDMLSYLVLV